MDKRLIVASLLNVSEALEAAEMPSACDKLTRLAEAVVNGDELSQDEMDVIDGIQRAHETDQMADLLVQAAGGTEAEASSDVDRERRQTFLRYLQDGGADLT